MDWEAEGQAVHFGMQLDVVIGPHRPRRHSITPLTKRGIGENDLPFPRGASAIGKESHEPDDGRTFATELLHCRLRLHRVPFGFLTQNNTQMKGSTGWTVEFAKQLGRPIYAFDLIKQEWYKYNIHTKTFHRMRGGNFPLLYKKSAIVGACIADG